MTQITIKLELPSKVINNTLPTAEILSGKNEWAFLVCGFLMKSLKKISGKYEKNHGRRLEVTC